MEARRGSSEQPLEKEDNTKEMIYLFKFQSMFDQLGSKLSQSLEAKFMIFGGKWLDKMDTSVKQMHGDIKQIS